MDQGSASALKKIIMNPHFKKRVSQEEQKAEYFRVTGAHEAVLDYSDLFSFTLHGDDIQDFDTRWDQVFLSSCEVPNDKILESLYKMRMPGSDQLKTVWQCTSKKQSRSIEAELSEVEDHGKEMKRSEDQDTKFSSQKRTN